MIQITAVFVLNEVEDVEAPLLGFTPIPLSLPGAISLLALTYLIWVQAVKTWFYRRHALL